ncbi:MAG: Asp-tRNA(Asn)/Glu-tRNA(Gln) amidotransferase subunit GatC [Clostridiales bacterium]|nr:MAG: Asp-tRNA(Asn)/Glu-tRNA(Gln) amidotransferase subunit GatC [Clostridiales bacterium]
MTKSKNLNMEGVIDFANKLNELDTENIAPTNHILDIKKRVPRGQNRKKSFDRDEILKNAPQKQRGCVVVPQTVEE